MKYGGITYSVPAKSIEDNFLKYSRRFRRYSSQSAFYVDDQNKLARPIANAINGQDINPKSDGLQMLLDAALEIEGQTPEKPNPEEKKYRAIEELVSLIGEDNLLEMLSN
ncbi:hypothetical protein BY458DRAFT_46273 [Sporodiniella umbellata]|nr:hypothetical protein BY458DRAFT_46273 [Sporodiniella umbellata]